MKNITLLIVTMLALTGCPDKGRSNRAGGPVTGSDCVNCGFSPAAFSQSVSSQIQQADLTISISGDSNQMNMWGSYGQNPLFAYQGPVTISGTLQVHSPLPFGYCQLPVGQYSVRSIQAGLYSIGVFQVPVVELVGPSRMTVALTEGAILTNGNGVISGFGVVMLGLQGPLMIGNWGYPQATQSMSTCYDSMGVRF